MTKEMIDKQPDSMAAVMKVFAILQALAEKEEMGITELSSRLALPKATAYRFLQSMKSLGYVKQEPDTERYSLTMKMFELGSKALAGLNLVELAKPLMQRISDLTGETVHLGTLIESEIIYAHKVDSRHNLGMYSRVGRRAPLHCTAIGKCLLAWEEPTRRDQIISGISFKRYQDKTITDRKAFLAELEMVRSKGFAEDREEFDDHIRCLGIPIFDRHGSAVAGMSVSFPTFRYPTEKEAEILLILHEGSREISAALGCTHFPLPSPSPRGNVKSIRPKSNSA
jgi:IclR family KDG regulon transcriptional repressor